MKSMYTQYGEIAAGISCDVEQCTWNEEELGRLEGTIKKFRKKLVETLDKCCASGWYILEYQLDTYTVKDIRDWEDYLFYRIAHMAIFTCIPSRPLEKFAEETSDNNGNGICVGEILLEGAAIRKKND